MSDSPSPVFNPFVQLVDPAAVAQVMNHSGELRKLATHIHRPMDVLTLHPRRALAEAPRKYCIWPRKGTA